MNGYLARADIPLNKWIDCQSEYDNSIDKIEWVYYRRNSFDNSWLNVKMEKCFSVENKAVIRCSKWKWNGIFGKMLKRTIGLCWELCNDNELSIVRFRTLDIILTAGCIAHYVLYFLSHINFRRFITWQIQFSSQENICMIYYFPPVFCLVQRLPVQ